MLKYGQPTALNAGGEILTLGGLVGVSVGDGKVVIDQVGREKARSHLKYYRIVGLSEL